MTANELAWTKAARSMATGACVELAMDDDEVALRNSREPDNILHFTPAELAAFLDGVKRGEFDHLVE